MKRAVERLCGGKVAAKGFFDYYAGALRAAGFGQPLDDDFKHARRNGEIVQRPYRVAKRLAQAFISCLITVIAIDVLKPCGELCKRIGVNAAMPLDTLARTGLQLIKVPSGLRHPDDR